MQLIILQSKEGVSYILINVIFSWLILLNLQLVEYNMFF